MRGHYDRSIQARALAIAGEIKGIADTQERTRLARAVCLNAVHKHPHFPEERFLRDCGIKVNEAEGDALRVKHTRYSLRTSKGHQAWDRRLSVKDAVKAYQRRNGMDESEQYDCDDDSRFVIGFLHGKVLGRVHLNDRYRMF